MGVSLLQLLAQEASRVDLKYQSIDDHTLHFPFNGQDSHIISVFAIYQEPIIIISSPVLEGDPHGKSPALLTEFLCVSNDLDFAKVCYDKETQTLSVRADFNVATADTQILFNTIFVVAQAANHIYTLTHPSTTANG
jgi:hypothetical protein